MIPQTLRGKSAWTIEHGGQVMLGDQRIMTKLDDLPAEVTRVDLIDFTNVETFGDAGAAIVGSWPKIKGISLAATAITDAGLEKLAALPLGNRFSVYRTRITGEGFAAFAEKSLGTVGVSYCRLSPVGWSHLAKIGPTNMWHCDRSNLTDAALAEIVAHHPDIKVLIASGTELTNASAAHLARLSRLQTLVLDGTGIADSGLEEFASLKNLQTLGLRGTKVTAAGVAKLQAALPQCSITWK